LNNQIKELVAMGAAAAANCHPCMDFHLAKCDELGIDREEVAVAVKVGLMVNRGAESAIRKKTRELLGETAIEDSLSASSGVDLTVEGGRNGRDMQWDDEEAAV